MRAYSDADLVQSNTGTLNGATTINVTVPSGTTASDAGLIVMYAAAVTAIPDNWDPVISAPSGGLLAIYLRADLPAGETSWTFTAGGGATLWTAGEWANVASVPVQGTSGAALGSGPLSTGSTGSFGAEFVMGVAAFALVNGNVSASGWPTVSYDNSFVETDSLQVGDGTGIGDALLKVTRRYGTDGDAGPWSCTATFTGSMTNKTPYAVLAVVGAEETADVPSPPITVGTPT